MRSPRHADGTSVIYVGSAEVVESPEGDDEDEVIMNVPKGLVPHMLRLQADISLERARIKLEKGQGRDTSRKESE